MLMPNFSTRPTLIVLFCSSCLFVILLISPLGPIETMSVNQACYNHTKTATHDTIHTQRPSFPVYTGGNSLQPSPFALPSSEGSVADSQLQTTLHSLIPVHAIPANTESCDISNAATQTDPWSQSVLFQDHRPRCFDHGCEGRTFSSMENFRRHIRERDHDTRVVCDLCGVSFSRKSNRDKHVLSGKCLGFKRIVLDASNISNSSNLAISNYKQAEMSSRDYTLMKHNIGSAPI